MYLFPAPVKVVYAVLDRLAESVREHVVDRDRRAFDIDGVVRWAIQGNRAPALAKCHPTLGHRGRA